MRSGRARSESASAWVSNGKSKLHETYPERLQQQAEREPLGNDAALWWRVATVAASVLAVLAAAGILLYFLSSPLFFEILDPRGITVRQALGSLVATAVTAAFVKYIVQHESRAAREQADKSAMDALQTDAASIVRAYAEVQTFYIEHAEAPRSLADRAAFLLGRKQEAAKGIDRVIWRSLLSISGSGE